MNSKKEVDLSPPTITEEDANKEEEEKNEDIDLKDESEEKDYKLEVQVIPYSNEFTDSNMKD